MPNPIRVFARPGVVLSAILLLLLTTGTHAPVASAAPAQQQEPAPSQEPLFDPTRDPAADLKAAMVEASATDRRIILDVGGNWCSWCLLLDRYINDDPELKAYVDAHYVWVRVNVSRENMNVSFLSPYPRIHAYPHLFVLNRDGALLHSQDTSELEEGRSYSAERMWAFLRDWSGEGALGRRG